MLNTLATLSDYDPDTHCRLDAPASVEARNAAIRICQEAYAGLAAAEQAIERLRRTAFGSPEHTQICSLRDALSGVVRRAWPLELSAARTDLQIARDALAQDAASRTLALEARARGGLVDTRGD